MKTNLYSWQTFLMAGFIMTLVSCENKSHDEVQTKDRTEIERIANEYGLSVVNSNQVKGKVFNVITTQALRDTLKKYYFPIGTKFVKNVPMRTIPGISTAERQRLIGLSNERLAVELRKLRGDTDGKMPKTGGDISTDMVCTDCPPDHGDPGDDPGGGFDPNDDYPIGGEPGAPSQDDPFDPGNSVGPGVMPPNDGPGDPAVTLFGVKPADGTKWQFAPIKDGYVVLLGGANNGRLVVGIQYNPVPGGPTGTRIAGAQVTVIAEGNMSNQVIGVPTMGRFQATDNGGMFINDILTYSYTPPGGTIGTVGVDPTTVTFTITIQITIEPDGTISNFLVRKRMNH